MQESLENNLKKIVLSSETAEIQGVSIASKALLISLFLNKNIYYAFYITLLNTLTGIGYRLPCCVTVIYVCLEV